MIRLFAIAAVVLFQACPVKGQHRPFDSLAHALESSGRNTHRVDILNELASVYYDYDSEKGFDYASQANTLAGDLKYLKGLRQSFTLQGFYFFTTGNYPKALELYRKSSAVPLGEDDLLGYNLVMTGNAYRVQAVYDSALHYYDRSVDILSRVDAPERLAYAYKNLARLYVLQWQNSDAGIFLQKALHLYQRSGNQYGIAETYFLLSEVSKNKADFDSANNYVEKACAIAEDVNDDFIKAHCLINRGSISSRLGDYTVALKMFFESLGILKSKDLPLMMASVYSEIGDVYRALNQNDVAWKYYVEALKIAERIGSKHEVGKLYAHMALIFKNRNDFKMAHEYLDKSLVLRTQIEDDYGISQCYNFLGTIYYAEKNYSRAFESFNRSLEIRRRINYREGITSCLYNLSLIVSAQNLHSRALQYQAEALAIEEAIGNKFNMGFSHNRLGNLYTKLKKYPQAASHLSKARKLSRETNSTTLKMYNHLFWSEFFEATRNSTKALLYYKRYSEVHDSIYNDIGAQKLAELQALYMIEKKDQEIAVLNRDKMISQNEIQLQRSRISQQNIIIISGVVFIIMISLLAYTSYRYTRRIKKAHREISEQKEEIQSQSEELIDANQTIAEINKKLEGKIEERTQALSQAYKELDTFFYRSSHDFRRPLTTFLGLAEVAKVTVKDTNALELFEKVKETASNLDKMLIKLQSISDVGSQQLVYKEVMIRELFDTVCDSFRDELQRKNIKTNADIRLKGPFISYPAMIKIIIENLVENAIYFSGVDNPFIKIVAVQSSGYVTIDIQDNGQGISGEYQEHVFDMYYRANERSKGNGLGLYIVKKAVEKLEGSISLSSIPLMGSTFTVMLPMANSASRIS